MSSRRGRLVLVAILLVVAGEAYGFLGVGASPTPTSFTASYMTTQGLCAGREIGLSVVPVYGNVIPVNATSAFVGRYNVYLAIGTVGQACDRYGNFVAVRHEDVNLTVRDLTHPFNATDIWFAGLDMTVTPDSPAWSITYSLPTKANVSKLGPGAAVLLGSASVEWEPQMDTRLNVTFSETAFPDPGLVHVGDTLRFTVSVVFVADASACLGACWSPFFGESFNRTVDYETQVVSA